MHKRFFGARKLIWASATLLGVLPAYATTIKVGSSVSPTDIMPPGQAVAFKYLANNNNMTSGITVGSSLVQFNLGDFGPSTSMSPTTTSSFTIVLTDSLDSNMLDFNATYTIDTSSGSPRVNAMITNGTEMGGFATISDGGYLFGVQQSFSFDLGKGGTLGGEIIPSSSDTPEPTTYLLTGLGLAGLAGLSRSGRTAKQHAR